MAIFALATIAGTGLGPLISGYIEARLGWRWIQWILMMYVIQITAS
jgi:hypothetical protein